MITIREVYDSFSVNGYMMDCSMSASTVQNGACSILDIRLWEFDLEENSIAEVSDITQIEFGIEIESGRNTIDEATLELDFKAE